MTSILIALLSCWFGAQTSDGPGVGHPTQRTAALRAIAPDPAGFDDELKPLAAQVASVYARHPMDASVLYYVAAVHARAGHTRQALDALRVMADLGTGVHPRLRDGFDALKGNPEFEAIADGIRRQYPPVRRARVALEIGEGDLVPEGIAWSDRTRRLYLGSVKRKIVSVTRTGEVNEFVAPGTGGLGVVLGLRVDDRRGELWAASGVLGAPEPGVVTGAFRFRLSDGRLISSYPVPDPGRSRLNDLAVAPDGAVYGTATDSGALFRIDPSTGDVTEFLAAGSLPDPNGITIPPDGRYAFVAGWYGIARVDLQSRETVMLEKPSNIADGCFDGLYSTGARELIGVQNCVHETGRIVRVRLDSSRSRLVSADVLESYNPLFDGITTAAPAGRELMFVANVQFWKLGPGRPPFLPLKILRLPLR